MFSVTLIIVCTIGLILLVFVGIGLAILITATNRDPVTSAREGWIQRRSDKDKDNW